MASCRRCEDVGSAQLVEQAAAAIWRSKMIKMTPRVLAAGAVVAALTTASALAQQPRGTGEGHRPWDRPNTTMTNATVDTTVAGVDGQVIMVKYKDGEKKIIVGPDAVIRAYMIGSKDELKPGVNINIVRATKKPDGTFEADRVNVGRDGIVP